MIGALLEGAALTRARLDGADLTRARLRGADLDEARLRGARLREARLESAYLREAQLQGANLGRARLRGANLAGADLTGANLTGARLGGALLDNARLTGAVLRDARLEGAHLLGARLQGADLSRARLRGADLRRSQLQGASLERALLQGADLLGASVAGTRFNFARLDLADIRRLRERRLTDRQFKRLSAMVQKEIPSKAARAKVLARLERARKEPPSFVTAMMATPGLCDNTRYFKNCVFRDLPDSFPATPRRCASWPAPIRPLRSPWCAGWCPPAPRTSCNGTSRARWARRPCARPSRRYPGSSMSSSRKPVRPRNPRGRALPDQLDSVRPPARHSGMVSVPVPRRTGAFISSSCRRNALWSCWVSPLS